MSFYLHTHSRLKQTAARVVTVLRPLYVGKISLSFMLLVFIALVGFFYLVNFNNTATLGYELTKLESERNVLKVSREQKNINLSTSQSLDFIKSSPRVRIMLPVQEVEYFDGKNEVAYRR